MTDPGVVTTRQAITPAGVQSVFDGRVYGVAFGASASELWVLTGRTRAGKAQLYRLDWLKNAVGGRWELEGAPALQGLAFDPERGSPLVGLIVAAARGRTTAPAARSGSFAACGAGTGRGAAAGGRRRGAFTRWPTISAATSPAGPRWRGPRRRAVVPLVFENELAIVDAASGRRRGPGEDRRRGAVRRGDQPRRLRRPG